MNRLEIKNTIAKVVIITWIGFLLFASYQVAIHSITFDINHFFALSGNNILPDNITREVKVIMLMLSVAIIGGVSFMIKDFYQSVKYANLYSVAYEDYSLGHISNAEFQKLVPVEIYVGRFNHTWVYWFFIQPVLSSVLGIIAFFIARSGLGLLQGTATVAGEITIQSIYMYAVFTFLAGFSSHKFIAWLDRLADKIFSSTLPEQKEEMRNQIQATAATDRINLKTEVHTETSELGVHPADTLESKDTKTPLKPIR